ncbi:MAG TPA: hypothetical protein VGA41_00480 [Candidatus Dormibacteraeota bacterium]
MALLEALRLGSEAVEAAEAAVVAAQPAVWGVARSMAPARAKGLAMVAAVVAVVVVAGRSRTWRSGAPEQQEGWRERSICSGRSPPP